MQALRATDPRRIGPYEVLGRLGSGGMGEVYLAESRAGLRLAVKVVRSEYAQDRTFRARFRQEVRAAQTVGGAGTYTARVVDADPEGEHPWMATEFVEGPNLRDAVLDGGALPEPAVRTLAAALGEALGAIHAKGMVHRDLKPSNILLAPDGPRVIDFGIVRALEATAMTRTGAIVGSVGYVSPEQIRNGGQVGPPSDVFSLGAVLAYAASGREPFGEGQDSVILLRILTRDFDLKGVPEGLLPLVESCLREEPGERPTPQAVVEAVGHTAGSLRESVRPGWFTAAVPEPAIAEGDERWLPERESGERESRVEYVAPVTVTDTPVPDVTPMTDGPDVTRVPTSVPSRRGLLRALTGGAVVAAAAGGVGGWLWLRDGDADRNRAAKGGSGASTGASAGSSASASATATRAGWEYRAQGLGGLSGPCAALSPGRDQVYVGGADGALHAVSPRGVAVWTAELGLPVMSPLSTSDGVYCLLDGGDGPSKLCALGHDGDVRWTRDVDGGYGQFLVAADGMILMTTGIDEPDTGGVRAYGHDGSMLWNRETKAAPTSDPVVSGGVVYVGTYGDVVQALDLGDGRPLWTVRCGTDVGRPVVVGGMLVVGASDEIGLHGILRSGKLAWSRTNDDVNTGTSFSGAPFGELVVTSGPGYITAVDPADGATAWSVGMEVSDEAWPAQLTVADDTVYLSMDAQLLAVDGQGRKKWTKRVPAGASLTSHSPVVDGDRVYTATADGIAAVAIDS